MMSLDAFLDKLMPFILFFMALWIVSACFAMVIVFKIISKFFRK